MSNSAPGSRTNRFGASDSPESARRPSARKRARPRSARQRVTAPPPGPRADTRASGRASASHDCAPMRLCRVRRAFAPPAAPGASRCCTVSTPDAKPAAVLDPAPSAPAAASRHGVTGSRRRTRAARRRRRPAAGRRRRRRCRTARLGGCGKGSRVGNDLDSAAARAVPVPPGKRWRST